MDGFLLVFQQLLDWIVAEAEALRTPHQKQSRHLNMFRRLSEQDAFFILETFCHCEEGQLAPCGVLHVHPPRCTAGLGKMGHGIQRGLMGKLGCERMEAWPTPNVCHPF